MINFSEDCHEYSSQEDLKDLINEVIEKLGNYSEGSTHGGLSPTMIQDIISILLYQEDNSSVSIKISKDIDDYHLYLEILNKEK